MNIQNPIIAPAEGRIRILTIPMNGMPREFIFLNFPDRYSGSASVLAWSREHQLRPIGPVACFEIGECAPELYRDLGMDFMAIVSLDPEARKAYGVSWKLSERTVILPDFDGAFSTDAWFVFQRITAPLHF
ncbi:MAG: hypothetical protein HY617_00985 [Candidatus Sungbacteria bacterium]|nr:hypothetical protein [Candidatus Sungbacteria bacterium]